MGQEEHTPNQSNVLGGSRRPNIRMESFWPYLLNLPDIPYNSYSCKVLDWVDVELYSLRFDAVEIDLWLGAMLSCF